MVVGVLFSSLVLLRYNRTGQYLGGVTQEHKHRLTMSEPSQYLHRVTQEHKHHSATSEPGQYLDKVTCITSLRRKPFSSFALLTFHVFFSHFHFSFFLTMHRNYSFQRKKRDPNLLRDEEVVPSENYFIYNFNVLIKVFTLTLLYLTEITRINPKTTD